VSSRVAPCQAVQEALPTRPVDWREIRGRIDKLAARDLIPDWRQNKLQPICDQFVRAAAGDVDRSHWQNIFKLRDAYLDDCINGWLTHLIASS
jgi:Domain of unknown function (DUF4419)